jgi:molybdate-binding protein
VGLRQLARGLGEIAHLARVHDGHRQRGCGERRHAEQLVAASGFEHDQGRGHAAEPLDERAHAALVIRHGEAFGGRQNAHDHLGFGDINPHEHAAPPGVGVSRRPSM